MTYNRLHKLFKNFVANQSGETAVQTTLIFCLAVVVGVAVGVPMLNNVAKEYAHNKNYGIDPVVTSSVGEVKEPTKTYTVRKSVLDKQE